MMDSRPSIGTVDIVSVVVATETDPHESGRRPEILAASSVYPAVDVVAAEAEEVVDVRLGAETPTAHADAVFVTEHGGDQPRIPAIHGERDHAELRTPSRRTR